MEKLSLESCKVLETESLESVVLETCGQEKGVAPI